MSTKFNNTVIKLAQQSQQKYGVPASVTLAQYALESGYGSSGLAKRANNYFGISGSYNGNFVQSNGRKWRKYSSMEESFEDHGRLLSSGRYATATAGVGSVGAYVDAIAEIYAPSSDGNNNYAGTVKRIIQDNNLTQYDYPITRTAAQGGLDVNGDGVYNGKDYLIIHPEADVNGDGVYDSEDNYQSGYYDDPKYDPPEITPENFDQLGIVEEVNFKDGLLEALGTVIKVICYIFLAVLAIVLFMAAFEMKAPKLGKKSNGGTNDTAEGVSE